MATLPDPDRPLSPEGRAVVDRILWWTDLRWGGPPRLYSIRDMLELREAMLADGLPDPFDNPEVM